MKLKFGHYLLIFIATFILAFSVNSKEANAIDSGAGGGAHNGQVADWIHTYGGQWTGKGTTSAWDSFRNNNRGQYREDTLKRALNKLKRAGTGDKNLSLYDACRRSKFIWFYGSKGQFNDRIGRKAHPKLSKLPAHGEAARDVLKAFSKIPNNGWNKSGGTVIICSYAIEKKTPPIPLTYKAGSKTVFYDKTRHKVTTYSKTKGKLKSGHRQVVSAYGSGVKPGKYPVTITDVKIVDSKGENVTNEYKIKRVKGTLTIKSKPLVISKLNERCKYLPEEDDEAFATVQNNISVERSMNGKPYFEDDDDEEDYSPTLYEERDNAALDLVSDEDASPQEGDPISKWNSFKSKFGPLGAKDNKTYMVDFIDDIGSDDDFSQYGGIFDVIRTHKKYKVKVQICQPQVKETIITKDPVTGAEISKETDGWVDEKDKNGKVVEKLIKKRTDIDGTQGEGQEDKDVRNEFWYYQILGVNCNEEGLKKLGVGGIYLNNSNSKLSITFQTHLKRAKVDSSGNPTFEWPFAGTLAQSKSFYNDGDSCKTLFKEKKHCTADKLVGALNDSDNNLPYDKEDLDEKDKKNPDRFTHVDSKLYDNGYGKPNKGILNIFRDNANREIRADVWYPRESETSGLTTYPGEPALSTNAQIVKGSPEYSITTIVPHETSAEEEETLKDDWNVDSKETGKNADPKGEIEGVPSGSKLSTTWNTSVNRFNIKSQWASKDEKEYNTQLDWEYRATVYNKVPKLLDGEGVKGTTGKYEYEFETHCAFKNTKDNYPMETPNNPFADRDPVEPNWKEAGAVRTLFTRSVSDKSQK